MSAAISSPPPSNDNTIWKEHPTLAGIRVSSTGRVQSRRRSVVKGGRGGSVSALGESWRELKPWRCRRGYCFISVRKPGRNSNKHYLVHRLVLESFVGPCPEDHEGLHGDGDPGNNRLENLRWGRHIENVADTRRHGNMMLGEKHYAAKLSESQVLEILSLLSAGRRPREVAGQFGVSRQTVEYIRDGKRWGHLGAQSRVLREAAERVAG
jgi:hypothetical protein